MKFEIVCSFNLKYKNNNYTIYYSPSDEQRVKSRSWFIHKTNSSTQVITAMKGGDGKYNKQVSLASFILNIPIGEKVKIYHIDGDSMNCMRNNLISIKNKRVTTYE